MECLWYQGGKLGTYVVHIYRHNITANNGRGDFLTRGIDGGVIPHRCVKRNTTRANSAQWRGTFLSLKRNSVDQTRSRRCYAIALENRQACGRLEMEYKPASSTATSVLSEWGIPSVLCEPRWPAIAKLAMDRGKPHTALGAQCF